MDRLTSMTAFTSVVTCGSFTAAAQRLNMSPAAISSNVRALEERLGVRLLNRTTRKVSLTEAGKAYFDETSRLLSALEEADARVAQLNAAPRGTLRITCASVLANALVPLFGAFTGTFADITLEVVSADGMPDLVDQGVDVAVWFNPAPQSSLIVRHLGAFRVIACASPGYLATHGEPHQPADLSAHNCLSYMYPGFTELTRLWRFTGARGEAAVAISGNLHTNNAALLQAAALEGRGIVLAPGYGVEGEIRAGRLVHVLRGWDLGNFPICALYPHRQHLAAKVRSFIDFAVKHFPEHLMNGPEARLAATG
jgi:DNA-binding transcriptional LysR family regulator